MFRKKHVTRYAVCPICGVDFVITSRNVRYCSDECKNIQKQRKAKPEFVNKECIICGKIFSTKSRASLCCGETCRKKHRVDDQTRYIKRKQAAKEEENRKIKEENRKKDEYLKQQQELMIQQKKDNFYSVFFNNENKKNYFIDDFKFSINEKEYSIWYATVWQAYVDKEYNSILHSNLSFDSKEDAIDFCYKIYSSFYNYVQDYDISNIKINKIENIKKKLQFPEYVIKRIESSILNKDYDQLIMLLNVNIKRRIKINITLDKTNIFNIISNNDNPVEILENYLVETIYELLK